MASWMAGIAKCFAICRVSDPVASILNSPIVILPKEYAACPSGSYQMFDNRSN